MRDAFLTGVKRVRVIIERDDGKLVGWDLGHPDDIPGRITAEARVHTELRSDWRMYHRDDPTAMVWDFALEIHTDGGYRVLFPGTRVTEEREAIEGTPQIER